MLLNIYSYVLIFFTLILEYWAIVLVMYCTDWFLFTDSSCGIFDYSYYGQLVKCYKIFLQIIIWIKILLFAIILLFLWMHQVVFKGLTPRYAHRIHSWWISGVNMGCWDQTNVYYIQIKCLTHNTIYVAQYIYILTSVW